VTEQPSHRDEREVRDINKRFKRVILRRFLPGLGVVAILLTAWCLIAMPPSDWHRIWIPLFAFVLVPAVTGLGFLIVILVFNRGRIRAMRRSHPEPDDKPPPSEPSGNRPESL
jgi:hypothetical protein